MSLSGAFHSMVDDHLCTLNATADKIHTEAFEIKECMQRIAASLEIIAVAASQSRNVPVATSDALLRAYTLSNLSDPMCDAVATLLITKGGQ